MRTHNSISFLRQAVESVLCQSYKDWELIISDDASTDGTLHAAEVFAARDPRIKLLRGEHLGPAENGNRCLRAATRPWAAVLDSDDVALPERLGATLAAARRDPDVVLWGGRAVLIDRHGRPLRTATVGPRSRAEYQEYRDTGRIIFVMSPTVMFRRELALELGGYDDKMVGAEDVELMTRLAEKGPVIALKDDLALYRVHGASISSTRFGRQQRIFDFLDLRAKLRLSGSDLTLEDFEDSLRAMPLPERLALRIRDAGRQKYRDTVVHLAERRFARAVGSAALACMLDPSHTYRRVRNRFVRS